MSLTNKLDASTGLTCISCHLVFANTDIQREHYRTEWHRYNVKRQVARLPPISQEDFSIRLKLFTDERSGAQSDAPTYCEMCRKPFHSQKAYDNHINSKRHHERAETTSGGRLARVNDEEHVDLVAGEKKSPADVSANMSTSAGVDADLPIGEDHEESDGDTSSGWHTVHSDGESMDYDESQAIPKTSCLFCSAPSLSIPDNLKHMSLRHGFSVPDPRYCIDLDGLITYLGMKIGCGNECIACSLKAKPFRDRDACQKHMRDKNHCFLNTSAEMILEYIDYYDYSELLANESDESDFVDDGSFLLLPSGAKIGHRSLVRYFRQSLKPDADGTTAAQKKLQQKLITNGHIKALGWSDASKSMAIQRARDMKCLKRVLDTYRLKQGLQSNKLFKTRGRKDQQ